MAVIPKDAFKQPVVGIDPITKGTFTITWANILIDYTEEGHEILNTRATGNVVIEGWNNPLFDAIRNNPLRAQKLLGSVMFGSQNMFVRFAHVENFCIVDDDIVKEIEFTLTFDILDNLEYLENIGEYKENNAI